MRRGKDASSFPVIRVVFQYADCPVQLLAQQQAGQTVGQGQAGEADFFGGAGLQRRVQTVGATNQQGGISGITPKSWLFLCLSGLATGASWLFYYRAIQIGEVSKVVPIDKLSVVITLILAFAFLHEKFTWKSAVGAALITAGTLIMVL